MLIWEPTKVPNERNPGSELMVLKSFSNDNAGKIHFCIFENDEMVSVTTSDNLPNKPTGLIQLGIDTLKGYRRKGHVEKVCTAFINYYLEQDILPVWNCYLDNAASVGLAKKLGFCHIGNEFFVSSATEV